MAFDHEKGKDAAIDTAIEGAKGVSSALMGSAFESFGKAMTGGGYTPRGQRPDDSGMANWRNQALKTQKRLEDRWHMAEFRQFRKGRLKKFEEDVKQEQNYLSTITKELREGNLHNADGSITPLDRNNEADRATILRMTSQLEADTVAKVAELQIGLNNDAAEKYANNPIVNDMIEKMMMKQTEMLTAQFRQPNTMAQAKDQMDLDTGYADIKYKESLTRQADVRTSKEGAKYTNTDAAWRDKGPAAAVRYFTNDVNGRALMENTGGFTRHLGKVEQESANAFIKNQGWSVTDAAQKPNQEMTAAYLQQQGPTLRDVAMGLWIKDEYGQDAFDAASASRPALLEPAAEPFKHAVKVMPSKADTEEKQKDWNTLGTEVANEQMRRKPGLSKEDAIDWLMSEWFPEALEGENIQQGGGYMSEFEGLTADQANKAVKPYIAGVRKALRKYAEKFVGTGPGTEQLTEEQRPSRGRRGSRGGLGRSVSSLFGKEIYPEKFRERHPKPTPKE